MIAVVAVGAETLVGRSRELAAVDALIERAAAGIGGALLIEGSAGMGKSRLLAEAAVRARSRQLRVLAARGVGAERHDSFAAAVQLFERLPGITAPTGGGWLTGAAALCAPLFAGGYAGEPDRSPFPLLHGLFWLSLNVSQSGPVLLSVDDAQWSDELSLRFLRYLVHRIDELPIALLVASRPHALGQAGGALAAVHGAMAEHRQQLAPLDVAELTELVRAQFPDAEAEFCVACAEVTGGNPFYVREMLRSVAEQHLRPHEVHAERLRDIGFTAVSRAALMRLGRLGPDCAELARALSVCGDGSPLRVAAALAGLGFERAADAADALAAEELITAGTTLSFAHPLIGQLVYDDLPAVRGALAHKRAARILATENASPEGVATHLLHAPPSGDGWVVHQLRIGARAARAKGAPDVAVRLLSRARDEPPASELRAEVLAELGRAESAAGIVTGVVHLQEALALCEDCLARAVIRRELARAQAAVGQRGAAARTLEAALDDIGQDSEDLREALLGDYLTNATFEPGLRQHSFSRAEALLGAPPAGATAAERAMLAALAMRSGQEGKPVTRTVELAERAWGDGVLLAEQGPEGPGWLMTVWALALAGDHQRNAHVAASATVAAQAAGSVDAFATASYFLAWARARMGRLVDALADVEQAVQSCTFGWRRYLVAALALKSTLLTARGDLDAAAEALALATDSDQGGGMELPWRMHAAGRLELAHRNPARALQSFLTAGGFLTERLGVEHTVVTWRTDAACAALALGDQQQASALLEHAAMLARQSGDPGAHGRALRLQGLLDGGDEELLRQAAACSGVAGELLERAQALSDLGATLRRRGDRVKCRPPLREALDLANRCGATPLAECAREELAASGARRAPRPASGPDSLTPSEQRIAEYARDGLTNVQIAQALFVTPKTVEYHLRHVYQKLAITSRSQLAASPGREVV